MIFWRIFLILLCVPSLLWTIARSPTFAWDQAAYGWTAVRLWILFSRHITQWPAGMLDSILHSRPPLLVWVAQFFVPMGALAHAVDISLVMGSCLFNTLSLILLFEIGRKLNRKRSVISGVLTALPLAASPLFAVLSTQFFVEPAQVFGVTLCYWVCAASFELNYLQIAAWVTTAVSLASLTKASTLMYCVFPVSFSLLVCAIKYGNGLLANEPLNLKLSHHWRLLLVGATSLLLSALWYGKNLKDAWEVVHAASYGPEALNYGQALPLLSKVVFWLKKCLHGYFVSPSAGIALTILILFALFLTIKILYFRRRFHLSVIPVSMFVVSSLQVVLAVIMLSLNIGTEVRYSLAIFPGLSIILAAVCALIDFKALYWLNTILFFCTYAMTNNPRYLDQNRWVSIANERKKHLAVEEIVHQTQKNCDVRICAANYKWLNANTLNYEASKLQLLTHVSQEWQFADLSTPERVKELLDYYAKMGKVVIVTIPNGALTNAKEAPPFANKATQAFAAELEKRNDFSKIPLETDEAALFLHNDNDSLSRP
jgi:hypothetical protein